MPKILINYRRDDTAGHAGRLYDVLAQHFGSDNVFMDIDTIAPGDDFLEVIREAVGRADVVIVLIGRQWLSVLDRGGRRRLDDPADLVRVEIETALDRGIRVIPVLVQAASMPDASDLPASLVRLARRNAFHLGDIGFRRDADALIAALGPAESRSTPNTVAVPPARHLPWRSRVMVVLAASVLAGGVIWLVLRQPERPLPTATAPPPSPAPTAATPAPTEAPSAQSQAPTAPSRRSTGTEPSTPPPTASSRGSATTPARPEVRIDSFRILEKTVPPGAQVTMEGRYTVRAPSDNTNIRVRESRLVLLRGQPLTELPARELVLPAGTSEVHSTLTLPPDAQDGDYTIVLSIQPIEIDGSQPDKAQALFQVRRTEPKGSR